MKLIDLSMTVQTHWRWPVKLEFVSSHQDGKGFQTSAMRMTMHTFTHVDTPLHVSPDRITIDQVSLDQLCGPAAVVDLEAIEPNQPITGEAVRKAGEHIQPGDVVLLKTAWDRRRDYNTREFWTEAPYMENEAANWLAEQKIKAVGFDFPQDYHIRDIPRRHPTVEELTTHDLILRRGIYLIEYLCNLHQINAKRVEVFALPLKIAGAEGAPARVIAVVP